MAKGKTSRGVLAALACAILGLGACASQQRTPAAAASASVPPLEHRSYIHNMNVLGHFFPGSDRWGKIQMMAVGERRFIFQAYDVETPEGRLTRGAVIEVTNPLQPVVLNADAWEAGPYPGYFQIQVAYSRTAGTWLMLAGRSNYSPTAAGHRGLLIYDLSDPALPRLISRWSVDGGDASRAVQTGSGTHRFWYDGGAYAYLSAAPDNSFYFPDLNGRPMLWAYAWGLQVIDVSDPAAPKLVSNWAFPGQRLAEADARRDWPFADDPAPMPFQHGPVYVPRRVEDGGRYGYGSWGSFGMVIHDLSDPSAPRVVSTWRPDPAVGPQIAVHTVDVSRLDRGFVIANPEAIMPHCQETETPISIVDVRDPAHPSLIANLPTPTPPPEAPYRSFCERYGRFGPHNPPHIKAPGRPDPNFTCYAYFNAGLQCFSIADPRRPSIAGYFIPEQGPEDAVAESNPGPMARWARTIDNVFIEWDRKLIWAASDTGLYLLSSPDLGEPVTTPRAVTEWALPGLNAQ